MGSIRLFDVSEDRGPLDPSWIVRWDDRLATPIDPNKRISELNILLEDDHYESQRVNVQAVISMYEQHILPDPNECLVHIQDGKIVPLDNLDLNRKPYWTEVFAHFTLSVDNYLIYSRVMGYN